MRAIIIANGELRHPETAQLLVAADDLLIAADGGAHHCRRLGLIPHIVVGDLDSLADVISFGVAPAVLGFTLGLRGGWDMLCLVYFVVCGVSRLARFNITAAALADSATGKVKYFEGTPIPTSIVIVALLGTAFRLGRLEGDLWFGAYQLGPAVLHPLALVYLASGSAMISATLRIPKP